MGVKGRWVRTGAFESDETLVWDPLRSHLPNEEAPSEDFS